MYVVIQEVKKHGKAFYTIGDVGTGRVVASARVDYTKRKSFWTYKTKEGAKITNKHFKRALAVAVNQYLADIEE